jgi:hypothetical protein
MHPREGWSSSGNRRGIMETEPNVTDTSEHRVLTQLGDTVTTKVLFLNGSPVHEDITIEGPPELIPIRRGRRSLGRNWPLSRPVV